MTYLPPYCLDGPDRDDARLDEQRDDERDLAAGLDALSRAAFTPWPPPGVDVERIRHASPSAAGESTGNTSLAHGWYRKVASVPRETQRWITSPRARLLARRILFALLIAYAVLAYLAVTLYVLAEWPA